MSTDDGRSPEARMQDVLADVRDSPVGRRLRDVDFRRRHAYAALVRHPSPVMREIGEQLRDGRMRPIDILRVPAYREVFGKAARHAAARLYSEKIAQQLEALAAEGRDPRRGPGTQRGDQRGAR